MKLEPCDCGYLYTLPVRSVIGAFGQKVLSWIEDGIAFLVQVPYTRPKHYM